MNNSFLKYIIGFLLGTVLYLLISSDANANLIYNGDFEHGDTGFDTGYRAGIDIGGERYNVTSYPSTIHPQAVRRSPTGRPYGDMDQFGNMLAVNGSTWEDTTVWAQYLAIEPNTDYEFGFSISSWVDRNPALVKFDLDGVAIGLGIAPNEAGEWYSYASEFNSGSFPGAGLLRIVDLNTDYDGNDFALDNLYLKPISSVPLPAGVWLFLSALCFLSLKWVK